MRMMNMRAPAALIGILLVFNLALALALALGLHENNGLKLVEVFKVTINNIDDEDPGDLYGTIRVTDEFLTQDLFNREKSDYQIVGPGGDALLTGPNTQVITASNGFTIDVALMDYDTISPNDHIADGQIEFNVNDAANKYDVPTSQEITGQYGSVTVVYAVLSNAVQATVEVTFMGEYGEIPSFAYGFVGARSDKFSSNYESVLFNRKAVVAAFLGPAQRVPLSRSILAVPLDSTLIVRADLSYTAPFKKDLIAKGSASFTAQLSGTSEQTISDQTGVIRVKVTWTNSLKHKTHFPTSPLIIAS